MKQGEGHFRDSDHQEDLPKALSKKRANILTTGLLGASLMGTEVGCATNFEPTNTNLDKIEHHGQNIYKKIQEPAINFLPFNKAEIIEYLNQLNNNTAAKLGKISRFFGTDRSEGLGGLFTRKLSSITDILFSDKFQAFLQQHPSITLLDAFALADSASDTPGDILKKTEKIFSAQEKARRIELLSPNTSVIVIGHHDQKPFSSMLPVRFSGAYDQFREIATKAGVKASKFKVFVGPESKALALNAIRNSRGPTTIFLIGHGSNETGEGHDRDFYLGDKTSKSGGNKNQKIGAAEFAQALSDSKNFQNISIIDGSCFGADRLDDIMFRTPRIDEMKSAIKGAPKEISTHHSSLRFAYSSAGYGRYSFGKDLSSSRTLEVINQQQKSGQPITVDHLYRARNDMQTLKFQLPAFFVGDEDMPFGFIKI